MHTEKNCMVNKFLVILVIAMMLLTAMTVPVYASTAQGSGYKITASTGPISQIRKDNVITVQANILLPGVTSSFTSTDISRVADGFSNGTITLDKIDTATNTVVVSVKDLKYKGGAKELSLFVKNIAASPTAGNTVYDTVTFNITECYSTAEAAADAAAANAAWEASKPAVKNYAKPTIIFSRGDLIDNIEASQVKTVIVTAKNTGKRPLSNAVLSVTPSDNLMIKEPQTSFEVGTIAAGASVTKEIKIKAFEKITSQSQFLDVTLNYDYISNSENDTAQGTDTFKLSVPAVVTKEKEEVKKLDSPIPNLIITGFDYGGGSVAANSNFNLSLSFKNTSKKIPIENVVATVDSGADFAINGGTNTFYFEKIKAGGAKKINLPLKVSPSITLSANTVTVAFTYEFIDNNARKQGTANLKVSVPEYQPDKFKVENPVIPTDASVGMETTITVNYVNKGKTAIANVAASISGDISTERPNQVVGNVESGKNGTIVFAFTPNNEGENKVKIKITYEDASGNTKKRVFVAKVNAMAFEEPEMPEMDPDAMMPEEDGSKIFGLNKWIVYGIIAAAIIAALIIIKNIRKKAKIKKQEALWAKWDEEESAKEEAPAAPAAPENSGSGENK